MLPNPSGARGVYVLDWAGARALCAPTVHDAMLFQRISALTRIDPNTVRIAAREVARGGFAGRAAIAAAETAAENDRQSRTRSHFMVLKALVEQADPGGTKVVALADRAAELDRRASMILNRIAPTIGLPAARLASCLAKIGDAFGAIGLGRNDQGALIPRLMDRVEATRIGLTAWLDDNPANDFGEVGRSLTAMMAAVGDVTATVLADTRAWATDPMSLLKSWLAQPVRSLDRSLRCDWLLDGWERVCLMWQCAGTDASRRAALIEMAQLVPVPPAETAGWVDNPLPPHTLDPTWRIISHNDSWRNGSAAFDLIRRNEALRAMCV